MYNSDGTSRSGNHEGRLGSYGVELRIDDSIVAQHAVFIGDETNNVAECQGVLAALKHAARQQYPRVCFRVDSKLVEQQLAGKWACRSDMLKPVYEECLILLAALRLTLGSENVCLEHLYREYNAAADSLANVATDRYCGRRIVVNINWC